MSEAVTETHAAGGEHEEHAHAGFGFYIGIAIFLAIVTGLEIWMVNSKSVNHAGTEDWVRFWLTVCSVAKFVGVVAFFMHLYFDRKLLTFLFCAGLFTAACTMVALLHLIPKPIFDAPDEKNPSPTASPADTSSAAPASDSGSPATSESAAPASDSASPATSTSESAAPSAAPESASPSPAQSRVQVPCGDRLVCLTFERLSP